MNDIIRIYKTIEDKLPFSIIRNEEGVEEEINTALNQIFMEYGDSFKEQISYLSYAYADIDYTNYQDLTEWKIKDFVKHFYFKDLYQEHVSETLKLLNQYFLLRKINYTNSAASPINSKYASTPLVLSQLLDKALIIKINVGSNTHFSNEVDKNLFHFTIKKKLIEYIDFNLIPNQVISQINNSDSYSINDYNLYSYESAFLKLKKNLIDIYTELKNQLSEENYFKSKEDVYIQEFICSIISVAFLSLKYNSVIYYIPSIVAKDNMGLLHNLGALIIGLKEDVDANEKLFKFKLIADRISQTIALGLTRRLYLEVIHHSTRAAISQVMARNMSHNIGSHVLSKLLEKEQLHKIYFQNKEGDKIVSKDDVKKPLTNKKVFYQCLNLIDQIDIDVNGKITTDKESNESLLAKFFQYLKARMDFLADVTTNTPVIENTKGIYNDIVKSFISNRVLNDRISGIDEFRYEIIVCKPPTNKYEYCVNHTTEDCRKAKNVISSSNDVMLSIPNDILGSHAFYTILENIIRNTAKHGTTPVEKNDQGEIVKDKDGKEIKLPVEFKIKVEEASIYAENNYKKDDKGNILYDKDKMPILKNTKSLEWDWNEFYAISIFDNCDLSGATSKILDGKELEKTEAGLDKTTTEIPRIQELVIKQNRHLNDSILEKNQLRHGAWGLIEMDASAAYLRKIDIELIDSDKYQITCLHGENPVTLEGELAIMQAYAEQGRYLGYRFFIRKPQEILIIGDDGDLGLTEEQKDANIKKKLFADLKNEGVWIYSKEEFLSFFKDKKQKVFPHKLVVVVNDTNDKIKGKIENNRTCLSKRYYISKDNISIDLSNIIKFKKDLWKRNFNEIKIVLYDTANNKLKNETAAESAHGWDYCERIINSQFIEIWTSLTSHFFSQDFNISKIPFYHYSWPLKIAVIDERIQSFSKERYKIEKHGDPNHNPNCELHRQGVKYIDIYRKTNIFVPEDNEANLNLQNFDEEYKKIISYINDRTKEHKKEDENYGNGLDDKPCEFVIIHLGIIEKLISSYNKKEKANFDKEKPEDISKFVKEVFLIKNEERYDSIVITSGRGKPHNLPPDIRYLNFSVVSNYMITLRNKFAFTEAAYSARKQN